MQKSVFLAVLIVLFFCTGVAVCLADRGCEELLNVECLGCHEAKYCDLLDKDQKFWKGMVALMESNGAELTKNEKQTLVDCLCDNPAGVAQKTCK